MMTEKAINIKKPFSDKLVNKLDIAYLCLDHSLVVQRVSENITEFGYPEIPKGSDITDYMDFMVGMDTRTELILPMITNPLGEPISVQLLPEKETVIIVISDASSVYEQRKTLQQHANDNELLLNQQIKLMKQLDEASRLQSSFLSGVSHEFRTPLTSIIGYTNLLSRDIELINNHVPNAGDYLSAVRRSSNYLLSLVENLLDHGKIDSGELVINPKSTNLSELFNDVSILLDPLTATKNIELNISSSLPEMTVLVDGSRLRQCLINIIGNAIKFTDTGSVSVDINWQNDHLIVKVIDTGPGISDENIDKILLPFWQAPDTGKAGTGLGLTITKRIIDLMGGDLNITSVFGQGTTVVFDLAAPKIDQVQEIPVLENSVIAQQLSMLLVEDDDDIADLIEMLLIEQGAKIERVKNGALAVEMVERVNFDLILMDIHMPIMSGYEAIELIRKSGNDTPIIVMSASPIETDQIKAEQLGCNGYLVKPVDVNDIFRLDEQIIHK